MESYDERALTFFRREQIFLIVVQIVDRVNTSKTGQLRRIFSAMQ